MIALVNWFRSSALDELERDAERYRYLRESDKYGICRSDDYPHVWFDLPEELDATIDAELRKERK